MAGGLVRFAPLPAATVLLLAGVIAFNGPLELAPGDASAAKRPAGKQKKKKKKKAVRKCRSTKKGPVYRSPGYGGRCQAKGAKAPPPLPSIALGESGRLPDMLVDPAGTAHIVWASDGGTGPDLLNYCRIKRGSGTCDNPPATRTMFPTQPGFPQHNDDNAGPKVLAVGDELALLSYRYPNVVPTPLGTSDSNTYLWLSDDGGESFTGPGLVGDNDPSGDAVVFGPPESPRIGTITDTRTGGTFFQAISPGSYAGLQANLGAGGPNRAYSGSLSTVDQRPVAAFADLTGNTFIRAWTGAGDPNDPANWSENQVRGMEPKLAAGPPGSFLARRAGFREPVTVSRLDGIVPGAPVNVTAGSDVGARDLIADPGGVVRLGWVDRAPALWNQVRMRSSRDGKNFASARVIAQTGPGQTTGDDLIGQVEIDAAADGGGFTAYVAGGGVVGSGRVEVAPFGNQQATGLPGLGGQPGGGAAPGTQVSCQEISYGAVQMLSTEGCLFPMPGQAARMSEGPIKLNGLEIVPEAGAKIVLGTRERTIDTVGEVTVQIRAPGGPIVLFRGELHVKLPSGSAGVRLFNFDSSKFPVNVKGFPVQGEIDVILREHSVEIPVSLKLPRVFGGLTGNVTLRASNELDLDVSSMRFTVGNLVLGPVILKDLDVSWDGASTWSGKGTVLIGGATIGAELEFVAGAFRRGFVEVQPVRFPGMPIFTNVYLNKISGGLELDPFVIKAGAEFGFQPLTAGLYTVGVDADLTISTKPVFAVDVTGKGSLAGLPISESRIHGDVDGYFSLYSKGEIDIGGIVSASKEINGFIDANRGAFGASVGYQGCVGKPPIGPCTGFSGLVSSKGIAGCANKIIGFGYRWSRTAELLGPFECDMSGYEVRAAASVSGPPVTGGRQVSLPGGLRGVTIRLTGEGGPPSVVLISPSGDRITPVPISAEGAASAPAAFVTTDSETQVGLRRPVAGNWTIEPQAGPAIIEVAVARSLGEPKVTAKVGGGKGRKRTLKYRASSRSGLSVSYYERIGSGARRIGTSTKKRGQIRFSAGDGPGGRRAVLAIVEQDGLPRLQRQVATYRAPGPIRPPKVKRLRIAKKGKSVTARWRRSPGASTYLVRTKVSDGRSLLRLTSRPTLRLAGIAKGDRVRITVTGRSKASRTGKPASATFPRPRRGRR